MSVSSGWGCSVLMYAVIKPKYQSSISEDTLRKIEKSCAETADMAFRPVYCPFCRAEKELGRYWCRLTNDMLYCPEMKGLPECCPLKEEKE